MANITKWISIFERCHMMYKTREYKDLNICAAEGVYFFYLSRNPGVYQEKIAKDIFVNKSSVTRSLQDLEKKGYVRREVCSNDKRNNKIYLTELGMKACEDVKKKALEFNKIITKGLNDNDIETLNSLLYKITVNASNYLNNFSFGDE